MAVDSLGAKRQPQFLDGGAPDIAVDPTAVADYAAYVGNRIVGTTAERTAATSWAWPKLRWGDETDGNEYEFVSGAWVDVTTLEDTGWIQPTFVNGWVNAAGGEEVRYRRLNGVVYLTGRIALGSTGTAFTLPTGFRPAQLSAFSVRHQSTTTQTLVTVNTDGTVTLVTGNQPNLAAVIFPVG